MYNTQKGFTLVELVVVIVLLGILGVTALGKFEDLSTDAATAANSGVAAEISSAAAVNYAANIVNGGGVVIDGTNAACTAALLGGLFQSGTFPTGHFSVDSAPAPACGAVGATYNCVINDGVPATPGPGATSLATVICTAP